MIDRIKEMENLELGIQRIELSAYYDNGAIVTNKFMSGDNVQDRTRMVLAFTCGQKKENTARTTTIAFLSPSATLHCNQLVLAAYNGLECTVLSAEDIKTN